jgi:hypothetical protein
MMGWACSLERGGKEYMYSFGQDYLKNGHFEDR